MGGRRVGGWGEEWNPLPRHRKLLDAQMCGGPPRIEGSEDKALYSQVSGAPGLEGGPSEGFKGGRLGAETENS